MSQTTKFIALGLLIGYMLSPTLDRVPFVNKLPKIGG